MNNLEDVKSIISATYENRADLDLVHPDAQLLGILDEVLLGLEQGHCAATFYDLAHHEWRSNLWVKQAILLYFLLHQNTPMPGGFTRFYDKIPLRFSDHTAADFADLKIRVVPPATVRRGTYIAPGSILMPSFINIGAHIGAGSMVDSWVTVGSCAHIGKHVHLSMNVGIGGVLEPLQHKATIIEDHCFIGAGAQIVEGVIVGQGSVISMGVCIGQSTPIYDRESQKIYYGQVPAHSVVVAGTLPRSEGSYHLQAAIIVKKVDSRTREKTSINAILRDALMTA